MSPSTPILFEFGFSPKLYFFIHSVGKFAFPDIVLDMEVWVTACPQWLMVYWWIDKY